MASSSGCEPMLKKILVALDGCVLSERALPYAAELAQAAGAALTLVRTADIHPGLHLGLPHLHLQHPSSNVTCTLTGYVHAAWWWTRCLLRPRLRRWSARS